MVIDDSVTPVTVLVSYVVDVTSVPIVTSGPVVTSGLVVSSGPVVTPGPVVVICAAAKQNAEPIKAQGEKTMTLTSSIDLGLHDVLRTYHLCSINMHNIHIRQRPGGTAAIYITSNNIPFAHTLCDNIVGKSDGCPRWPPSMKSGRGP